MKAPRHAVLLVEDDMISSLGLKQHLERHLDVRVLTADRSSEALQLAQDADVRLLLMDVRIQGPIDGIETARRIQEQRPLPVMFITASSEPETFDRAQAIRPLGFFVKPYNYPLIASRVSEVLSGYDALTDLEDLNPGGLLKLVYDTAQVGMCVTDGFGRFVKVNQAYCKLYGYTPAELVGQPFTMVLPPDMRQYAAQLHDDFLHERTEESAGDWQVLTKHGELRDIFVTAGRMVTASGQRFKVTTVTDVTEQKQQMTRLQRTLRDKDMYAREVHHRVKNNLNMVSSLLYLQADRVSHLPDVYRLFLESMARIRSMSMVHEQLYQREELDAIRLDHYLAELAGNLHSTFAEGAVDVELQLALAPVELNLDRSISLGLIVNEVLSNSLKHAFPDGRRGRIGVELAPHDDHLQIHLHDDGVGLPSTDLAHANSLGLQIVNSLVRQLNARLEVHTGPGTRYRLAVPLANR